MERTHKKSPDLYHLPKVSIVVIGFNEAKNLYKTFQAIASMNYPQDKLEIIYVDSGSTDGSVELSRQYVDKFFVEAIHPTPARNRNRGLIEAKYDIVHFVDGDVIIDKEYLRNAVSLFIEKDVHAVVGQLDEQRPNVYNKMASLSNALLKEGYTHLTATGATYLKSALLSINGYDERISRGEEIEIGGRFNKAGFKVWCTNNKMGSHNFDITNLWQYVKRYEANARSSVRIALMRGDSKYFTSAKHLIQRQTIKGSLFVMFLLVTLYFESVWPLILFLLVAWMLRNRGFFMKSFKRAPFLVMARSVIDLLFFWMWWYGYFIELINYLTKKSNTFFELEKMNFN